MKKSRSQFGAFVVKEFTHILRDKRTMLILFLTPIVLIFLFSYAISTEIRNINVVAIIPDNNQDAQQLMRKVDASEYFDVVDYLPSATLVDQYMKSGKADMAVIVSSDGKDMTLAIDASNPNIASSESMYMMGVIREWMSSRAKGMTTTTSGSLTGNVRMLYNPQLQSSFNFVPGILGLILMLICALMTSVSVVREKETGTMEVLLVSPVKPLTIIFAKMIPYMVMGCLDLAIILLMSYFLLGIPMSGSLFWIIVSSLVYIMLGLSIGLLVSTIAKSQIVASLVCAIVFLFPMLMLSGMMFPLESMPGFFQVIANIIPAKWYVIILRRLMIQGTPVVYIIKELLILVGIWLVVMAAALKKFNDKLE